MSDQDHVPSTAELRRVNAALAGSLQRCSAMVRDYRARLMAANSNEPGFMLSAIPSRDAGREADGEHPG